jgi:hypothetical protein
MGNTFARVGAVTASMALLGACASQVGPEERTEGESAQSEGALGVINIDIPPIERLPPPPPPVCPPRHPMCSATPWAFVDDVAVKYGCGPFYYYLSGYSQGVIGGIVALCPDTRAVRAHYGLLVACQECLPEAPKGSMYIFLREFIGPGCSHGCEGYFGANGETPADLTH